LIPGLRPDGAAIAACLCFLGRSSVPGGYGAVAVWVKVAGATIVRYALSSTRFLLDQGADFLVIACNTATALALEEIKGSTTVPVLGVIETAPTRRPVRRRRGKSW